MKLIDHELVTTWEFDAAGSTHQEMPPYVSVTTSSQGPRAMVRPPNDTAVLLMSPGDVLLQLKNGAVTTLHGHAATVLLREED